MIAVPSRQEVAADFTRNLERVDGLVDTYDTLRSLSAGSGQGRATVQQADVLRSAAVFLHASFEDNLRGLEAIFLPRTTSPERLVAVGFPVGDIRRKEKISLRRLANFGLDATIGELVTHCVTTWLDKRSYNHWGEVRDALQNVSLDEGLLDEWKADIIALMSRRHHIVHRADRNAGSGSGHHLARSLSRDQVKTRKDAVEKAGLRMHSELS